MEKRRLASEFILKRREKEWSMFAKRKQKKCGKQLLS